MKKLILLLLSIPILSIGQTKKLENVAFLDRVSSSSIDVAFLDRVSSSSIDVVFLDRVSSSSIDVAFVNSPSSSSIDVSRNVTSYSRHLHTR